MGVRAAIHTGTDRALDHRVYDFQVRGIKGQREVHRPARRADIRTKALVIFDVTRCQFLGRGMVKLSK